MILPSRISWFIALRYLLAREGKALASTITLISVAGVAVGVAALIVVIGVMDGARIELFAKMTNLFPHLKVTAAARDELRVDAALLDRLRRDPEVVFAEPILEKGAIVRARAGIEARKQLVGLIGVDPAGKSPYFQMIAATTPPLAKGARPTPPAPGEILLGDPTAAHIKAMPGDPALLIVINPARSGGAVAPTSGGSQRVAGSFSTGFYAFDSANTFINDAELRSIFRVPEGVFDYVYVRLKDPFRADAVRTRLNLPADYAVQTWGELTGDFFGALTLQKLALFIILLLIVLVAAFNIIGTLILIVIQKTREVGILRAVGASRGFIMRVFLADGIVVGLVGTALGVALGVAICWFVIPKIPLDMPAKVYNFTRLPVHVNPATVAIIVAATMLICTLAALFPARSAARLNPVEALRYD